MTGGPRRNSAWLVLTDVEEVADITQARSQIEGLRTDAMIGNKGCDVEELKKFCRMATRHDTLGRNSVSLLTLVCIWLFVDPIAF